ncbi:DUF1206 domain-containing protein [Pseudonocardia sp. H11422]|uniref:DUF1206 domain-containing protein n=1 Tax=Pseudonocardia sp. H11422 TaxID=2835866 RepID=UPI002027F43C|nr:DUF1206 domain-containing protein [Pseudonocardia sp. H11422]
MPDAQQTVDPHDADPDRDGGSDLDDVAEQAADTAEDVVDNPAVHALGRIGLVAYGAVHLLIAGLAVQVALGDSEKADKSGALQAIAASGFGVVLLWVIAVGLGALVIWQLAEAIWGHRGVTGGRRVLRTAINLVEAVIFGVLAYSAGSMATAGGTDTPKRSVAVVLFELPAGQVLVALIGIGVLVLAGYAVYRGLSKGFRRDLDLSRADPRAARLAVRLGQVGWPALGVAYGTTGVLLVLAAVRYNPDQPVGLDAGLKTLGAQPYGQVLLLVLALGLAVFGVYCLFDARHRKS